MRFTVDLQFFSSEKTEKATPKKRQDVRKKGQTAKSQEVPTALILAAVFMTITIMSTSMFDTFMKLFRETFQVFIFQDLTPDSVAILFKDILLFLATIVAPVFLAAFIAALVANYIQVGFLFTTEPLKMKLERIDPLKGAKRLFSLRAIVELIKSILKISIIAFIAFGFLWANIENILGLNRLTPISSVSYIGSLTIKMGLFCTLGLVGLALLDYMYQKFEFEKSIRMSKQDIKDEYKNMEGDPLIRSKIKQRQREMAMRRMMQEVPAADVVITNPTHYAIALKYDESKRDAPYVVAKGVDFLAQKIKMIAKEHQVVMVENRPLARALYDQVEIGEEIPEEFFKAVAEILAYVYRIKKKA